MDRIGDYVFLRELGRGVHGRVFLARAPTRLGLDADQVAVKVLAVTGKRRRVRCRRGGAEVYSPTSGPERLLELHDVAMDGGTVFYAMRHEPSGRWRPRPGGDPPRAPGGGGARRPAAAHELHEAGIVHRAIKPGNMFLDHSGALLCRAGRRPPAVARGHPLTGLGTRGDPRTSSSSTRCSCRVARRVGPATSGRSG